MSITNEPCVTPALVAKRQRIAPLITANGTMSDLVAEQRR